MAEMYAVTGETLTGIADAIRSKTGSDEMMTVAAMASAIEGINSNYVVMKKAAVEGEIIKDKYLSGADAQEISYGGWDISPYYILDGDYFHVVCLRESIPHFITQINSRLGLYRRHL